MYHKFLPILFLVIIILKLFPFLNQFDTKENTQYKQLKKHLEIYLEIKNKGGWQNLKEGPALIFGIVNPRVRDLKKRLFITKEFIPISESFSDTFDINLENAIKKYQHNHGLNTTGIVDQITIRELNNSIDKRIHQIKLNMERWKEMPTKLDKLHILINIAAGDLDVIVQDSSVLKMKVIVGRLYRKTPVFNADMTYIEFNPYWIIPPGIMKRDILPKLKNNLSYLELNHMQIYDHQKIIKTKNINWDNFNLKDCPYKIIQSPGSENPMGVVKFTFPNKYYVYLHDTPSRKLFEESSHTYSSGCIRLSKARELAKYLLKQDQEWSSKKVDSLIDTEKNKIIYLMSPVKVYVNYFTVWISKDGSLQFAPDIYKRDI